MCFSIICVIDLGAFSDGIVNHCQKMCTICSFRGTSLSLVTCHLHPLFTPKRCILVCTIKVLLMILLGVIMVQICPFQIAVLVTSCYKAQFLPSVGLFQFWSVPLAWNKLNMHQVSFFFQFFFSLHSIVQNVQYL